MATTALCCHWSGSVGSVVWLDLPRRTVMRRIIRRSACRVAGRAELWNGNRGLAQLLTWNEQESVISWAWHHDPIYRQRYAAAANDPGNAHLTFNRIATSADARWLIDSARHR